MLVGVLYALVSLTVLILRLLEMSPKFYGLFSPEMHHLLTQKAGNLVVFLLRVMK